MNVNTVKKLQRRTDFEALYPEISNEFFIWLIEHGYFEAPASTKYHGAHEGGLFDHSYHVACILRNLTEANSLAWQNSRSPIVIGLFHDICKIDQYKQAIEKVTSVVYDSDIKFSIPFRYEYRNDTLLKGHGDKSVMMLASHMQLTEEEVMCIRYHMGAFIDEDWDNYTRAIRAYPNVLWTHHADMIASHVKGV